MTGRDARVSGECGRYRPTHEYTHLQEVVDNLPYLLMGLCGSAIFLVGFGLSGRGWTAAGLYFAYCLLGALWIMLFVCPYCQYHGNRSCPCGYGQIAARLVPKRHEDRFAAQFRKHIPVIVPLWVIPMAAGIVFYARQQSALMLGLLLGFGIDAFVVLPLVSRLYGCGHCPQKETCPWMLRGRGTDA